MLKLKNILLNKMSKNYSKFYLSHNTWRKYSKSRSHYGLSGLKDTYEDFYIAFENIPKRLLSIFRDSDYQINNYYLLYMLNANLTRII